VLLFPAQEAQAIPGQAMNRANALAYGPRAYLSFQDNPGLTGLLLNRAGGPKACSRGREAGENQGKMYSPGGA